MIIRGTTPTISFNIKTDLDLNEIAEVWITFKTKPGVKMKEKTYTRDDVTISSATHEIILSLSQEDTLAFADAPTQVQMRLRLNDGSAYASGILETTIGRILKDGVI